MKIYEEAMDQCLLCIDFDFENDSPLNREIARRTFGRGAREKEWWRYDNAYLGLEVFTAYVGPNPAGHVELIPIENAPRPIEGNGFFVITCLHVSADYQGRGIGKALLQRAEEFAEEQTFGVALIALDIGPFMPTAFFLSQGYKQADYRHGERLLFKEGMSFEDPPTFLPIRYRCRVGEEMIAVDYIHCPQCARSGQVLEELNRHQRRFPSVMDLQVIPIAGRNETRGLGISHGLFIDGDKIGGFPPDVVEINELLEDLLPAYE